MSLPKRYIITGANGYLGSEVCKELARQGEQVVALARPERQLDGLSNAAIACHTYDDLPSIFSKGDVVVHCAGKIGITGAWSDFESVNRDWSVSLFKQAAECGVSCFMYVSSVAALGYKNRREETVLDESAQPRLVKGELYGRSKWLAEQSLQRLTAQGPTRLIILRPGLIYGRRPLAKKQTWLRRGTVVDPKRRIPLIHIDNFINAVEKLVENPDARGVFFVVDNEQPTQREFDAIKHEFGLLRYPPWRIGRTGFWLLALFRQAIRIMRGRWRALPPGFAWAQYCFHTARLGYSTEKIQRETGWDPTVGMEDGLKSCITATRAKARS